MLELANRFTQIRELNDGLSTLMCMCMAVYGGNYSKIDIEEAMELVDKDDYSKSDREAIIASLITLTGKQKKKRGK